MTVPDFAMEDVAGNRITVETVTSAAARVTIQDDDDKPLSIASALITPEDADTLADAVRAVRRFDGGPDERDVTELVAFLRASLDKDEKTRGSTIKLRPVYGRPCPGCRWPATGFGSPLGGAIRAGQPLFRPPARPWR
jgi:hypothetical protein